MPFPSPAWAVDARSQGGSHLLALTHDFPQLGAAVNSASMVSRAGKCCSSEGSRAQAWGGHLSLEVAVSACCSSGKWISKDLQSQGFPCIAS